MYYKTGILVALVITIIFISIYAYLFANSSRKISSALSEAKLKLSNQKKTTEVAYLSAAAVPSVPVTTTSSNSTGSPTIFPPKDSATEDRSSCSS